MDKKTLIEGIRRGNPRVLRYIYKRYHPAIVKLVEANSGTKEDAHDVFQEALMVLYQKTRDADFSITCQFLTYFYAISRNIWSNRLRKKSGREASLEDTHLEHPAEADTPVLEKSEEFYLYRKMFLRLGDDCQKVLRLFLRKMTMQEIMEQMGYGSISYTKKRKFLCKEKLISMIKADPGYDELKN